MKRGSERPCAARGAQFVRERENQSCKRFGGALPAVGEPGRPVRARKSQSFSRCRVPGAARRPGPGEGWWPVGERTPTPPGERAGSWPERHATPDRGSTERTPGAPRGAPEGAARGQGRGSAPGGGNFAAICGTSGSGARQNAAPARTGRDTLPLFAALAPPGPRKPALPLEREANPPGIAAKWHGRVRYFRSEAPCFWRFPGRSGDLARESR